MIHIRIYKELHKAIAGCLAVGIYVRMITKN